MTKSVVHRNLGDKDDDLDAQPPVPPVVAAAAAAAARPPAAAAAKDRVHSPQNLKRLSTRKVSLGDDKPVVRQQQQQQQQQPPDDEAAIHRNEDTISSGSITKLAENNTTLDSSADNKKTTGLGLFPPLNASRDHYPSSEHYEGAVGTRTRPDEVLRVTGQPELLLEEFNGDMSSIDVSSTMTMGQQPHEQLSQEERLVLSAERVEEVPLVVGTPTRPRRVMIILALFFTIAIATAVVLAIIFSGRTDQQGNEESTQEPPVEPGTWAQIAEMTGAGPAVGLGFSVALSPSGEVLAVGEPKNNDDGLFSGQVRVFRRENNEWVPLGKPIQGTGTSDEMGASVALSANGNILCVGASQWFKSDGNTTGYARVFSLETVEDTETWVQIGQDLLGRANGDRFGWSVAVSIDGSAVAVGAFENSDGGFRAGQAVVFRIDEESQQWLQLGDAINGTINDSLGTSVSLAGGSARILAIGADQWEAGGPPGYAKVFELLGEGTWSQVGETLIGEESDDRFGNAVALSLSSFVLAVGAWSNDANGDDAGHVRIYDVQNGRVELLQIGQDITGDNPNDKFGRDVALSADGSVLIVGAEQCCGMPGYARVYRLEGGNNWTQYGQDLVGAEPDDRFGWRVSISANGKVVAVGGYGHRASSGLVRVYEMHQDNERWIRRR